MEQTNQESFEGRPVVESDPKSVQVMREILQATIKSAPSKNASGGIKSRDDKVIAEGKDALAQDAGIKPDKDIAASKGTAAHISGCKLGEGKAITSEEVNPSPDVAPETDTATHISRGKEPETDTKDQNAEDPHTEEPKFKIPGA
jgi:hypothetical protein